MGVDEFRACEHLKADEKESILWAVKTVRTLCSEMCIRDSINTAKTQLIVLWSRIFLREGKEP